MLDIINDCVFKRDDMVSKKNGKGKLVLHVYDYNKEVLCTKCHIKTERKELRHKIIKDIENEKRTDYKINFYNSICPICKRVYSPISFIKRGVSNDLSEFIFKKYFFNNITKKSLSVEFDISITVISEIINNYMDERFPDRDDKIEKMYLPVQYIRSREANNCYIICQYIRDERKIKMYDLVQDLPDNAQLVPESKTTKEWQQNALNLINSHSSKNFRELRFLFLIALKYVKL